MKLPAGLKPLGGTQWRYCAKVGLAAGLGYLLTQGNASQYAVYSAFTAALIVGANFGEDLATSANRVKGTLVGMAAGMTVSAFLGPSALAVGVVGRVHGAARARARLGRGGGAHRRHAVHHHRSPSTAPTPCATTCCGRSTP